MTEEKGLPTGADEQYTNLKEGEKEGRTRGGPTGRAILGQSSRMINRDPVDRF